MSSWHGPPCVCICMCIYILMSRHTHTLIIKRVRTCIHSQKTYIHTYIHTYLHTYIQTYWEISHACVHEFIHVCTYVCVCKCTRGHNQVCCSSIFQCTIWIHTSTYIYIHIYIYTHITHTTLSPNAKINNLVTPEPYTLNPKPLHPKSEAANPTTLNPYRTLIGTLLV